MSERSTTDKLWIGIDAWGRSGRRRLFKVEVDWPEMEVKPCPICGRKPFVSGIANCKADDRFFAVKSQCGSLIDLFETNLLDVIRQDEGIDSLEWVVNLCDFYKSIKAAYESEAD